MPRKISDKNPPRIRLIAAGRRLFFAHGYAEVSTDQLVREASTSKATLYKYFGGPSGLFETVVATEAARFEDTTIPTPTTFIELREALIRYGAALLSFLNDPEIMRFSQTMHENARAHPEIARLFFEAAFGKSKHHLADMIEHTMAQTSQSFYIKPLEMADMLLGMWEGTKVIEASLGISEPPFPDPEGWAAKGVDILLSAFPET